MNKDVQFEEGEPYKDDDRNEYYDDDRGNDDEYFCKQRYFDPNEPMDTINKYNNDIQSQHSILDSKSNEEKTIKFHGIISNRRREQEKNNKVESYLNHHFYEVRWRDYTRSSPNQWSNSMKKS